MRFQRLDLGALALRHPPGERLAGADIVGVALSKSGGVGDGGVARHPGFGRPVPRERARFPRAGLVGGCQRLRQPHPCGRDAAGRSPGIGDDGAVAGDGKPRAAGRVAHVAVGIDLHRGADLAALQRRVAVGVGAGVGERDVAGGALVRRRARRVLAHRQHRGREHRGFRQSVGQRGCEEGHRHREVARHHRDVRGDGPDAGLGDERDADIAARHRRRGGHALGRLAHRDAVQHRIERPPGLEPDEPGHVGAEYRRPRRGEHQQHRDREGADVEAFEDDLEQRHPGLGLAPDGPVGGDGLGLGSRASV